MYQGIGFVVVGKYVLDLRLKAFEVTVEGTPPFKKRHYNLTESVI